LNIIGHGIDLIDLEKFGRLVDEPETDFLTRCFTTAERAYAEDGPNRTRRLAGRFAAKEACSKALGTGFRRGVYWRDMGVVNLNSGKPTLKLTGGARKRLRELTPEGMVVQVDLTMTDELLLAEAVVIISAEPKDG